MVIISNDPVCFTADLLEKVGELVEKLFDLDEELMKSWITAQPSEEEDDGESRLDVPSCLLEAAKQLRWESEIEICFRVCCVFMIIFTFNGNRKVLHRKHLELEVKKRFNLFPPIRDYKLLVICEYGRQLHCLHKTVL